MVTFLLVPGAGGAAHYWYRVVPLLAAAGHTAVAVELPNADGVGFVDHTDAIVAAAGVAWAAGATLEVVIVAQSMGGFAAPAACFRLPVRELVLLNAMIPLPGETAGDWWANTGQGQAKRDQDVRENRDPDADFDPMTVFLHDVPAEVLAASAGHDAAPADSLFATSAGIDSWPPVDTRVLVGRDDRLFPAEFQQRVARERLGLDVELISGGHLTALGHPEELVAVLLAGLSDGG